MHAPLPNRSAGTNPPMVVVVMGPPKVGKTTLIKVGFLFFPKLQSLIKKYTKQTLTDVRGPITVVSGKNRRLTFIECPNDISSMIDLGKIADLVLLLVDGSFGFEMETFEFLNVLQTHGFPRVLGIVTHLDAFKESKLLVRKAFDKFANFLYRHFGKFFGKRVSCFSALRSRIENFLSVDYS